MTGYRFFIRGLILALAVTVLYRGDGVKSSSQETKKDSFSEAVEKAESSMGAQKWAEAATYWGRVVEMNPYNGRYWTQMATCRYRAKDYAKAIAAFEKALEFKDGYPFNPAYNIACCYALMGEKAKALDWLERALDLGFRNLQHIRTDDDLKSLHSDARFIKLAAIADTSKMSRDEGWRFDLDLLAREIKRLHYDPYRRVSEADFDAYVKRLHSEIPKLTDHQITVGFMKLTAMAGDGHTSVRPAQRIGIPVQFYLFTEGLFIISADAKHADIVGAQVLKFGDRSIDEVMSSLDVVISKDNDIWPKLIGPNLMRYPSVLNGLGLIASPDKVDLTIKGSDVKERAVSLMADSTGPTLQWVHARKDAKEPEPLYMKNRATAYWYEYLPDSKTVYFQYNQVRHDVKDPLPQFCDRLFKFINENDVERLVIDIRWNGGGNNFLNRPITHGLIRCDKINQQGKLFVIVGRNTFSAAMCGATDIERHTNAIFVGEPTGSSPNFIGETIMVDLPYSKMRASISDLYWQNSVAMDYRTWIAPQLYAPPTFESYMKNRDPAMEAILAYRTNNGSH